MPEDTKTKLQTALAALKTNLKHDINSTLMLGEFAYIDDTEIPVVPAMQEFAKLINETIEIIEADLEAPDEPRTGTQPLVSLQREALLSHYLEVVNTLNRAITNDPNQMNFHRKKLEELASVSKPALKTVLYKLASAFSFLAAALLNKELAIIAGLFVGAISTPFLGFALGVVLLAASIPVSDKVKATGYRFNAESSKHYYHAKAVYDMNKKKEKLSKKNKDIFSASKKRSNSKEIELTTFNDKDPKKP